MTTLSKYNQQTNILIRYFGLVSRLPSSKLLCRNFRKQLLNSQFWPTSQHTLYVASGNKITINNFVILWPSKMLTSFLESWELFEFRIGAPSQLFLKKLQKTTLKSLFLSNAHPHNTCGKWKQIGKPNFFFALT